MMISLDKDIVGSMSDTQNNAHYQRYITDRFEVQDIKEVEKGCLCALILDKETGEMFKLYTGERVADGKGEVIEEGVVYRPPRADVSPFMLPTKQEMLPLGNFQATRSRDNMNNVLEREQMMMPYDDDDDKMIIVLSGEY